MADDQIRAQRDLLLRHLRVFRALGQDVDGDGEHVLVGIGDGGDAALDIFGRREVVKAHDGHILRDAQTAFAQRVDGAAAVTTHISPAKAPTAALGRRESKVYEDIVNGGRTAFLSAPAIDGLLEGGVPIMKDGQCLGAVGVSGVKSSEDAQIARAGIAALGL